MIRVRDGVQESRNAVGMKTEKEVPMVEIKIGLSSSTTTGIRLQCISFIDSIIRQLA